MLTNSTTRQVTKDDTDHASDDANDNTSHVIASRSGFFFVVLTTCTQELLKDLISKFTIHVSFVTDHNPFGINHYTGSASYDITHFIEKDSDLLNSAFISLLRNSSDRFISNSQGLVWRRRDIGKMIKLLFKLKFHLGLYVTLHLSFLWTTLYLPYRMNTLACILDICS